MKRPHDMLDLNTECNSVNSLSVALRAGYLSVRTAEGASEKQSSLKARLRNGLTYLLTYLNSFSSEALPWIPLGESNSDLRCTAVKYSEGQSEI